MNNLFLRKKATFNPIDGTFTYWENFLNCGQATGKNGERKGRFIFSNPTDGIKAKVMAGQSVMDSV